MTASHLGVTRLTNRPVFRAARSPQLLVAPVGDVGAQQIGAFRQRRPVVECGAAGHAQVKAGRALIRLQAHHEAGRGALVALHQPTDLAVDCSRIERLLGAGDPPGEALECNLDPPAEPVVHRLLFAAAIG